MKEINLYRFKDIKPVVSAKELIDVVLSRTQRKTPTEIHKGFKITRIRNFYMRKVKMCQELFKDKLQTIINDFPKLDDIHPFYSDLANILYDRDHYKLALGQCSYASKLVVKICHDYIKLLKFSSSLYKCKMLKISALGRMCKLIKKLQPSLLYLEEVRQNLSRLPSINPHKKTILLSGAPNVGKSSFINYVSRANVEVQPYSFTTKSLYVGHFDYNLNRYQIIDTPGLLDRSLENRNTIEMTTITALAHINGVILFIIDISEECGMTIKEQINLLYSIKSLFSNKSIVIGLNKIDKGSLDNVSIENKLLIKKIVDDIKKTVKFCSFSTLTGVGVEEAKIAACELLKLDQCSNILLDEQNIINKKLAANRAVVNRTPFIPESVIIEKKKKKLEQGVNPEIQGKISDNTLTDEQNNNAPITMREMKFKKKNKSRQSYLSNRTDDRKLEIDLQNENGGAGVYSVDIRKNYSIDEEYKYDVIPEIYNGKNISDFIDINIEQKLLELEKEEEMMFDNDVQIDPLWFKTKKVLEKMAMKLKELKLNAKLNEEKQPIYHKRNKTVEEIEKKLDELNIDKKKVLKSMTEKSRKSTIKSIKKDKVKKFISKRKQIKDDIYNDPTQKSKIYLSTSTELQRKKAYKLNKVAYRKIEKGTKGEADRSIPSKKPRHLFSGKRPIGKTSRR
ncbi:nucleolar GTP-binding protein 1, putative [Plasmodium berghei]|uniref:Nucleolar GTP-binding protein 1 n=2 Tax=Plasmodium berghei TaxID=5821 RepID=A0A509AE03_PLABA|nr:nucleolar GTP-binding protein 1, putative [Plasmodium berghei ANKA]CXH83302.1 nucleolar GTP-binding protein 1, putative [Plasmodium berghei]SCM19264.1 nucleolar GTP-binding protein 1, putative [Plasmodium berghei]SCN21698.1 nucleolar GTP-binding protein 1, putative [Plasmodium berghei]SCO58927.1 nucleolar GTP-binding protein 1, putative [Plasmodium berghei]SCO58981.1 nucleolar GTP-binding protein 1, putative [Plasmodium berghei]|eukprot:XP_034419712.1 nucleolar GTP-binding protein 1, putative [Plasmodium berghei ANKA]